MILFFLSDIKVLANFALKRIAMAFGVYMLSQLAALAILIRQVPSLSHPVS